MSVCLHILHVCASVYLERGAGADSGGPRSKEGEVAPPRVLSGANSGSGWCWHQQERPGNPSVLESWEGWQPQAS